VERATRHLELAIEVDSEPISGSVSVSNGTRHSQPFIGWIELVAAIEAARSSAALVGGPGEMERQTLGVLPGANGPEL
jgi:hypothetical protein